jgi:Rrf2 family cysteine metabolism transcriptional repressor
MKISTRGEYGVRVVVDLARHYGQGPRSLTEIAQAENLPLPYLEQLIKFLRDARLVVSTRGAHGGYELGRPPEAIRMGEVVRVLEGPIAPMICAVEGEMTEICERLEFCTTKYLWAHVRDVIAQTLDSMTLADLLAEHDQHAAHQQPNPATGGPIAVTVGTLSNLTAKGTRSECGVPVE